MRRDSTAQNNTYCHPLHRMCHRLPPQLWRQTLGQSPVEAHSTPDRALTARLLQALRPL